MKRQVMKKLRLYVWEGAFADYTSGIAFALAYDADHARKLIARSYVSFDAAMQELKGKPKVYSRPHGGQCSGGG